MKTFNRIAGCLALTALAIGCGLLFAPGQANALSGSDFNPARIIDDGVFFNANTMNPGDIQNFLNAKVPVCDTNGTQPISSGSSQTRAQWAATTGNPAPPYICLKNYIQTIPSVAADAYCNGIGGGTKSAADIIFNVAQACGINPESLIVLLQKEQALITDDWPWPVEYQSATGYGCPDTAPCDAQYYGFFNQLYNAGHQIKRYIAQPQLFNYAVGRNSFIAYNPSASCGGSNVTIQTQATAALYNYTPYQPNQAALGAGYGSAPPCGSYGNRNFWLYFNDWFGPTQTNGFTIALSDDGSQAQFLLFGGIKQAIPDPQTKIAWGIQNYPLVTMPASYLATIPSGPYLDRLTRLNTSDQTVFFMDGGKRYRVMSQAMFDAWNFGSRPITNVPPALFYIPADGGQLTYSVKDPSSSNLYMVDGGNSSGQTVLRQYQNDHVFAAWEGEGAPFTSLSTDYFNQIDNAIGTPLTTTKITYSGSEYQVINGSRFSQPNPYTSLYPGVAQTVSTATANRLNVVGQASQLIRDANANTVYLVDNGMKHAVANPSVLAAWQSPGSNVEIVNASYVSLIPDGSAASSYAADVAGQLYVMNGNKLTVPPGLDSAYRSLLPMAVTPQLISLYPQSSAAPTGFIKGAASPSLYLLDSSGQKRHIDTSANATLLGAYTAGVTVLPDSIVNTFPVAANPQTFVSDGTTDYLIESGTKHPLSSNIEIDWGLSAPQVYSDGTLTRFPTSVAMASKLRDGSNYYLIKEGRAFLTTDVNIAGAWGINDALSMNGQLITSRMGVYMLTRFVQPTTAGDNRIFVVDQGQWYNVSSSQLANLGGTGTSIMGLNPSNAPNTITDWTNVVVQDHNGKYYVIDGGTKRGFANSIIQNWWTGNGVLSVPTMSNGFLDLLPNNGNIERAIKGSGPAVYSAEDGTKRHILYPTTYQLQYAPYASVSDALLNTMPTGSDIQ